MKAIIFVCLAGLALAAALPALKNEEYDFIFSKWATQHGKEYATKAERALRLSIFKDNLDYIRKHQANPKRTHHLTMNKFGDMNNEEFVAMYNNYKPIKRDFLRSKNVAQLTNEIPSTVNWVTAGKVNPIKDQGQCGSCWAFSAVCTVESSLAVEKNKLISLSEQQLVDCAQAEGNQGCNGGLMDQAFQFVMDNKGICTEAAYPYTAQDGTCQTTCTKTVNIAGFTDVTPNNATALKQAVAMQPISIAVDASGSDWQFYSGGTITDANCGTQLDHGVVAVGYGSDSNGPYWLVRNSWGTGWGMGGYLQIMDDQSNDSGICGINMDPSYPTGATVVGKAKHSIISH